MRQQRTGSEKESPTDGAVRMLLVEDDRVDCMAFERFVRKQRLPYSCAVAASVREARERLASDHFDIIVADFFLGDGTSFDFLEDCRDTPFIVVTGTGTEETAVEMMKRGAHDYIIKDPEGKYLTVLPSTVKNALDRKAAEDELRKHREHLEELVRERTAKLEAEIKDRLRAEREKQALLEQLHQAQKMEAVGQLAAGIAHDFNNMLTVVSINAERIRSGFKQPVLVEISDMILESVNQATGVTRSLLTFSRELPGEKRVMSLREAIQASARLLEKLLPASIEFECPVGPDGWISGDPVQIQQVILNLAINARDAMPDGGKLRIEVRELPSSGARSSTLPGPVQMVVRDTGTGMSEDVKRRIFEPFFTTKPRTQGTGLGLAIVHGILKDHDAEIQVQSECGKGTEFIITFRGVALSEAGGVQAQPLIQAGSGECVLLAEDHKYLRSLMVSSLVDGGYSVVAAADGAELLEHFHHYPNAALLIMDIQMPKMGGVQCLERVRRQNASLPVILMTGQPTAEADLPLDAHTCLLRKPFTLAQLAATVSGRLQDRSRGK